MAGGATTAAILYLLILLRLKKLTAGRLVRAALFYSAFAIALAITT